MSGRYRKPRAVTTGDLRAALAEERENFAACSRSNQIFCERVIIIRAALRDAMAFYDRVCASRTEWTAADVKRLAELRNLMEPNTP